MSISICWRPSTDEGKQFSSGTSTEYAILIEQFGELIHEQDAPTLRAMAKSSKSDFYNEVADVVERIGAIRVWDSY